MSLSTIPLKHSAFAPSPIDSIFDKLRVKPNPAATRRSPVLGVETNVKQSYWTPDFNVKLPDLNDEQQNVLDDLLELVATDTLPPPPIVIHGSGGSGKTLLLAHFQRELFLRDFEAPACSYTNKAVGVLKERGIAARTIHRTLYQTKIYEEVEPVASPPPITAMEAKKAPTRGAIQLPYQCYLRFDPTTRGKTDKIYLHGKHIYYCNPFTSDDTDVTEVGVEEWYRETGARPITEEVPRTDRHDTLLMDEFSMVTKKWYEQAKKQFKHIFLFGDLMQLPPIEDGGIDLANAMHFTLKHIMRTRSLQAEQQHVREYGIFPVENTGYYCNTLSMPIADIAAKIARDPVNVCVLRAPNDKWLYFRPPSNIIISEKTDLDKFKNLWATDSQGYVTAPAIISHNGDQYIIGYCKPFTTTDGTKPPSPADNRMVLVVTLGSVESHYIDIKSLTADDPENPSVTGIPGKCCNFKHADGTKATYRGPCQELWDTMVDYNGKDWCIANLTDMAECDCKDRGCIAPGPVQEVEN